MLSHLNLKTCSATQSKKGGFFSHKKEKIIKKGSCSPEDFLGLSDCYIINNLISPL